MILILEKNIKFRLRVVSCIWRDVAFDEYCTASWIKIYKRVYETFRRLGIWTKESVRRQRGHQPELVRARVIKGHPWWMQKEVHWRAQCKWLLAGWLINKNLFNFYCSNFLGWLLTSKNFSRNWWTLVQTVPKILKIKTKKSSKVDVKCYRFWRLNYTVWDNWKFAYWRTLFLNKSFGVLKALNISQLDSVYAKFRFILYSMIPKLYQFIT